MNLKSGYPFWLIKDGLPFNYKPLSENKKTTVAILGGGISSALAAYHLAEANIPCIVLDKRTIGLGSTCCSTALLQYELDIPLSKLKDIIGLPHAAKVYQLCYDAIDSLQKICKKIKFNEFEKLQSIYVAAFKKDIKMLEAEFTLRKEMGFPVKYLDPKQLFAFAGIHAPAAIVSQQAAVTNAYALTHALFQFVKNKSVSVYDRTNIVKIKHSKKNVILTTESGLTVEADLLLYANGYEAIDYIGNEKKNIKIESTYALCTEQGNAEDAIFKNKFILWNTADPYLYLRHTSDNRIMMGGRDEPFYNPVRRDQLLESKTKLLTKDFKKLYPSLHFKPEFSWCGSFASTTDSLPFIGTLKKLPNSFFALGYGGNGITFSVLAAQFLVDSLTGIKNKDLEIFSFNR